MTDANRNAIWARAFMEELSRAGVREICLSPGSRSTPLVLAGAALPGVRMFTHLDERCAGFFALGIAKATGRPAAVVTTSGTAAANLYPAVIEASQGETPLLVLTADRPHRLRDADGNQAIDQLHLYGGHARRFFEVAPPAVEARPLRHLRVLAARAVAEALGTPPGPVHLNFPFDKPLEPAPVEGDVAPHFHRDHPRAASGRTKGRPFTRVGRRRPEASAGEIEALGRRLRSTGSVLIVAGPSNEPDQVGPAAVGLAAATGFPLLADPLSGARFGPGPGALVLGRYDLFLRDPELRSALRPRVILRVGASPTSAALRRFLEERRESRQIVVDAGRRWKDHLALADDYLPADPTHVLETLSATLPRAISAGWRGRWERLERRTAEIVSRMLAPPALSEPGVLREVARAVPEGGTLFVSSSMPVRELDAFGEPREEALHVAANRGASGIDGIVSTALGMAAGGRRPVAAVLGDIAFHHDTNGLLAARRHGLEVLFVVIHNDGGGIFHHLPIRAHEPEFTSFFATPHGLDFRHAAALHSLPFRTVSESGELDAAIRDRFASGGSAILEVRTDREEAVRVRRAIMEAVREGLREDDATTREAGRRASPRGERRDGP